MVNWRNRMIEDVKQQLYSKALNSQHKIYDFFEKEFMELVSEIEKEYPGTCKVIKEASEVIFTIGKNKIKLVEDVEKGTINLFISRISSKNKDYEQWGIINFKEETYIEMLLPMIDKGKKYYLDKGTLDYVFKSAYEIPWTT